MKLQTKFLIFFISLFLLLGGLIIFLSKRAVHSVLLQEVEKRALLNEVNLPSEMTMSYRTGDEDLILSLLQLTLKRSGAVYAISLNQEGRVLAHTNVVEKGKIYRDDATIKALHSEGPVSREMKEGGRPILDVSIPVWSVRRAGSGEEFLLFGGSELKETTRLGVLRLGLPIESALETERHITRQVTLIIAGAGGAALCLALLMMRSILRRVRLLSEGTEKISRGEYQTQVPVSSKDELGDLARSFNRMSEELALAHTNLEEEVKRRTSELETFVYTVSHDLKSPVVSMQGMATIFLEDHGDKVDEKGKHYLRRITANANYMEELINGLLTLSRVGKKSEKPEMSDAETVVEEIVEIHRDYFKKKGIEIVVQGFLPRFTWERVELRELFQNLITNAAKFMGDQPRPRIEIGGREMERGVEFYVKDNGIGIDPAYQEKIFGVFHRLKDIEVEGTGVGLSIVKKIVDLAGGKIWIESSRGRGATFFIQFPKK